MPYKNYEKAKEMVRRYYWKNREIRLIKDKIYQQIYKEKISIKRRKKYMLDRDEILLKKKKQYKQKCEQKREYQRKWRLRNPNHYKEWRIKNPLKAKAIKHRRRTLEKDLNITTIQRVYEDNIKKFGTLTCYLCLNSIPFGKDHLEHKIPLSRGGTNEYINLDIACAKCNLQKSNRTEMEYRKEIKMLNKVIIVGRLTKDPELRYTSSGTPVCNFFVASSHYYKDKNNDNKDREETCFINIIAWGKRGENINNQLHKGDPIFVEGRLQSRNWKTKDGQKRTTIEIVADDIQFLNRAKKGTSPENEAHKDDAMQGFEVEEPEI